MPMNSNKASTAPNVVFDKAELKERLTPIEYQVTQEKSTERWAQNPILDFNP